MRERQSDFLSRNIIGILVILTIVGIMFGNLAFYFFSRTFEFPLAADPNVWGTFGDYMGGVLNPIFSFLAFLALLITIILQNKELSLSRDEMAKSADALVDQSKAANLQNFERTYFQMIKLHNEIVSDMAIANPDERKRGLTGRSCFEEFYKSFKAEHGKANARYTGDTPKIIDEAYEVYITKNQAIVGHYFRNMYTIVDFVDRSSIDDKKHYIDIVRAQLSSFELGLLFYNCLWWIGRKKFKVLVERHRLLTNLNIGLLMNAKDELPLYDKSAYGDLSIPEQYNLD